MATQCWQKNKGNSLCLTDFFIQTDQTYSDLSSKTDTTVDLLVLAGQHQSEDVETPEPSRPLSPITVVALPYPQPATRNKNGGIKRIVQA